MHCQSDIMKYANVNGIKCAYSHLLFAFLTFHIPHSSSTAPRNMSHNKEVATVPSDRSNPFKAQKHPQEGDAAL